jgi:hypothetical protein
MPTRVPAAVNLDSSTLMRPGDPLQRALARGVDPSPLDSDGATPLHVVGEGGDHVNPEMIRALVTAGADPQRELPR